MSPVDGDLYVVAVATKGYRATTTVSGMGLTWTLVQSQCGARQQTGVDVWMGTGTPSAGTISATLVASTSKAVIVASRYSGVDPGNPFGAILSSNTSGVNGACSGGADDATFSFELQTNVHDASVFVAVAGRHRNLTPGNGYLLRDDARIGSDGTVASVSILDQQFAIPTTALVDGTFDGDVDWAVVSIEIKPGAAATKQTRNALPVRKPGLALRNGVGGVAP
ncbi:MAG: hypothetical protein GWN29_01875, partial [Gammaproteobacteria bacterium]|nr:hypothetical protein [Gammaproteobacteria bacterium]